MQIMMTTGIGRYCRTWSEKGRFWPLGLFDYNVLLLLFPNGADIVSITIWKIIILCLGTLFLFKVMLFTSKDFCSSLLCMGLLLFNQVFFSIHMTNRAAERFLYFSLALFAYSYYLGYSKNKNYLSRILWYISAFLCAIYSTYAKEVAFVIFVSIPLIELLFNNNLDRIDKYFQWSLLTNAIVFLLVWTYRWFYVERFKHTLYNNIFDINFSMGHFFSKVESMFSESYFLIIALFLLLIRGSRFLILHDYKHIFSDALLFAGGAYVLATFYCCNVAGYRYLVPFYLCLPSFAEWLSLTIKRAKTIKINDLNTAVVMGVMLLFHLPQDLALPSKYQDEGKIFSRIADAISSKKKVYFLVANPNCVWSFYTAEAYVDYILWQNKVLKDEQIKQTPEPADVVLMQNIDELKMLDRSFLKYTTNLEDISDADIVLCDVNAITQDQRNYLEKEFTLKDIVGGCGYIFYAKD